MAATAMLAQPLAQEDHSIERAATQARATDLRDAFVKRIHAAGLTCAMEPPRVAVDDVPSFGNYNPADNTLHTSDWTVLKPEERALFFRLAGPQADETAARSLFEPSVHQYILIHEMGHWWQTCRHFEGSHYQREYDANRISLAYWREVEPDLPPKMLAVFQSVLDHSPSPLPPGQPVEDYFNKNYQQLGPSPAYPWFMSRMNLDAYHEEPRPAFATALQSRAKV